MSTFWLQIVINEGIGVASAFVGVSNIKPGLKAALENLIAASQAVLLAIHGGQ